MTKPLRVGDVVRLRLGNPGFAGVAPGETATVTYVFSDGRFHVNSGDGMCCPGYWDIVTTKLHRNLPDWF